jgi:hypothetical protein
VKNGFPDYCGKPFIFQNLLVGAVGIEPTTFGLKGRCSTTELRPCLFIRFYTEKSWIASEHFTYTEDLSWQHL